MTLSKQELRRAIRTSRGQEPEVVATARAHQLAGAAGELSPWATGGVGAYLPTNAEPDVGPLLRVLGVAVYLPRVTPAGLEWVAAVADEVTGMRAGIPRPEGSAVATGADVVTELGVRLLLVPALAVDPATGTRLGYGGGWYDRLLAEVRAQRPSPEALEGPRARTGRRPSTSSGTGAGGSGAEARSVAVGVCRADDLVTIQREQHDEPLDGVLTEDGLVWFAAHA